MVQMTMLALMKSFHSLDNVLLHLVESLSFTRTIRSYIKFLFNRMTFLVSKTEFSCTKMSLIFERRRQPLEKSRRKLTLRGQNLRFLRLFILMGS